MGNHKMNLYLLQPVCAVLQWTGLLQRRAHLSVDGLLLLVQIIDDLVQSGHQLTTLLFFLICGHMLTNDCVNLRILTRKKKV